MLRPREAAGEVVAGLRELDYDVLVLAFGSRANDFGIPGIVEHCHFIDSQDQPGAFNVRLRLQVVRALSLTAAGLEARRRAAPAQ